jgi:hypothetical protein
MSGATRSVLISHSLQAENRDVRIDELIVFRGACQFAFSEFREKLSLEGLTTVVTGALAFVVLKTLRVDREGHTAFLAALNVILARCAHRNTRFVG